MNWIYNVFQIVAANVERATKVAFALKFKLIADLILSIMF